ncbi:MAG: hypothetical protein ACR2QW_17400 [bacterium]
MTNIKSLEEAFVATSAVLTGYDRAELYATGCVEEYLHQFRQVVPEEILEAFLEPGPALYADRFGAADDVEQEVRRYYLSDGMLGPPARSLIQLWYLGQWAPLPDKWRNLYGASRFDVTRIISARAYKEGLVWDAIGAHPMGAKQQGFGAWATEPPKPKE